MWRSRVSAQKRASLLTRTDLESDFKQHLTIENFKIALWQMCDVTVEMEINARRKWKPPDKVF